MAMERRGTMRLGGAMVVRTEISRSAAAARREASCARNARTPAARSTPPFAFAPPQRPTLGALDKWPPDGIDQGCRCVWQHGARDGAAAQVGPVASTTHAGLHCSHPAGSSEMRARALSASGFAGTQQSHVSRAESSFSNMSTENPPSGSAPAGSPDWTSGRTEAWSVPARRLLFVLALQLTHTLQACPPGPA
jgi:hypothetical protein